MIQICSGITSGIYRVLNGELYAQRLQKVNSSAFAYRLFHEDFSSIIRAKERLQKLIYLHLLTGCFMKISLSIIRAKERAKERNKRNLHETTCKQMQIN